MEAPLFNCLTLGSHSSEMAIKMMVLKIINNEVGEYVPTVGWHDLRKQFDLEGMALRVEFLVPGLHEDYDNLRELMYEGTNVIMLCFCLNIRESFEEIEQRWLPHIRADKRLKSLPIILIGLRNDVDGGQLVERPRTVAVGEGEEACSRIKAHAYLEYSPLSEGEAGPELEVELVVDVHDTAKHSTDTGGKAPTMGVATVAVALLAVVNGLIWYTGAFGFYVGLAALALHATSGLLLLAMLFAKGVVLCTGVSLRYIGQSHEFDAQIDRELAAKDTPFEDLYLRTIYAGFACSFKPLAPWMNVDGLIEDVKHRYPKSMCGWAVEASLHRGMGEWQKAVDAYRTAQRVATEFPEHNPESLVSFLLPCSAEHAVQSYSWAMSLRELVPGEVWVLNTPLLVKLEFPGRPWEINTTIVKLHSGDVVIFNPGTFTEESDEGREMLKRVRAIGRIVAVVSTTAPHGVGLERARHFFPEAKLYGVEPSKKHQRPEVSWDGWLPLMDASEPFGEELVHLTLRGQAFCETVFYHRSSGTLIGLTDTVMKTDGHDWVFRWYLFGLGMWRSSRTTKYACQSYNYMMVTNPSEYRASIAKMLSWDIRTVVFGHGGIEEGASECQRELRGAFQWILEGYNHSKVARIGLWLAWMENSRFLYIMMRAASGKLVSSLFGSGAGKSDAQRE